MMTSHKTEEIWMIVKIENIIFYFRLRFWQINRRSVSILVYFYGAYAKSTKAELPQVTQIIWTIVYDRGYYKQRPLSHIHV